MAIETLTVVLQRGDQDDQGMAILRCRKTETVSSIDQLYPLLSDAVTEWVRATRSGRMAWLDSEEEFSVVHLYLVQTNPDLQTYLRLAGIHDLTIESVVHDKTSWGLDEVLVNEKKLKEGS